MEALPREFLKMMSSLLDKEEMDRFLGALSQPPQVSVRTNPAKPFRVSGSYPRVPWCQEGLYLDARPPFTFDPLWHSGAYYVQEASSMYLEQVLQAFVKEPVTMLDLCASPGGKSTHAISVLPEGSFLVCNELVRPRAEILRENLVRWGSMNVAVTSASAGQLALLEGAFDVILADVPCSGEGMFRKDDGAILNWSPGNVLMCQKRQREILEEAWRALRCGGILIYSTCTYNPLEDEENVRWVASFLGAEILPLPMNPEWGLRGPLDGQEGSMVHLMPHLLRGEGLFMAALRKSGTSEAVPSGLRREAFQNRGRKKRGTQSRGDAGDLAPSVWPWLKDPQACAFRLDGDILSALPSAHACLVDWMRDQGLRFLSSGVEVARLKGREIVPSQALALSTALCQEAFQHQDLEYEQAVRYLRREAVPAADGQARGYVLMRFRGMPLGWAKNVGGRANNLYPQAWRILSTHVPEAFSL